MAASDFIQPVIQKTSSWSLREWIPASVILQILVILLVQLIGYLIPKTKPRPPVISLSTDMSFVEFETKTTQHTRSKDLSDEVIAVDKLKDDEPINWNNAKDPTFDFDQRYVAILSINNANEEYPSSATTAKIGVVQVNVRMYIDASGQIRDVKILNIRSRGGAHKPFKNDFIKAAKRVIMYKTKLKNQPYKVSGVAKDFVWETTIAFTLQ